jgi:hypothetical protein
MKILSMGDRSNVRHFVRCPESISFIYVNGIKAVNEIDPRRFVNY